MVFLEVMLHPLPLNLPKQGYLSMRRLGGSGIETMHAKEVILVYQSQQGKCD